MQKKETLMIPHAAATALSGTALFEGAEHIGVSYETTEVKTVSNPRNINYVRPPSIGAILKAIEGTTPSSLAVICRSQDTQRHLVEALRITHPNNVFSENDGDSDNTAILLKNFSELIGPNTPVIYVGTASLSVAMVAAGVQCTLLIFEKDSAGNSEPVIFRML